MSQTSFSSADLSAALAEEIAKILCAKLLEGVLELDAVTKDQQVNQAIAGQRRIETLGTEAMLRVQKMTAEKTGKKLADAVRLADDALRNGTGYSVWIGATYDRVLNLFNRALDDYASHGAVGNPLAIFFAQTLLVSVTQAMGHLGLRLKNAEKRKGTARRDFLPEDYPDRDVRMAIVEMAFNDDENSKAFLQSLSLQSEFDRDGRISLLLAANRSDGDLQSDLGALAGRILAAEPAMFDVRRRSTQPTAVPAITNIVVPKDNLLGRAQAAAKGTVR